jgi:mannan endo-1,4-beta-mannosidase
MPTIKMPMTRLNLSKQSSNPAKTGVQQLLAILLLGVAVVSLVGCKTGIRKGPGTGDKDPNPPKCAKLTTLPDITTDTSDVFNLLAGLTCSSLSTDGYLMGQNAGFGNQVSTSGGARSYGELIVEVKDITGNTPMVAAIDYEHDQVFTIDQLKEANTTLKKHWDDGGIVSISWMPLSPWAAEIEDKPGHTLYYENAGDVVLADLWSPGTQANIKWREKLDVIAAALLDLQEKGVPVLWRPFPEMNKEIYWWGTSASGEAGTAELFTKLWLDTFDYLTVTKGLKNLLWVYSPSEIDSANAKHKGVKWAYPGSKYVNIVAGIARNDALQISSYSELVGLGHPLGMAEYGPLRAGDGGKLSAVDNGFDARTYADRLHGSYPAVAYWVSWHTSEYHNVNGNLSTNYMALVDTSNLKSLTDRKVVLSVEKIKEDKLLK